MDRVDAEHLPRIQQVRNQAGSGLGRGRGPGPDSVASAGLRRNDHDRELEKENAAKTWNRTFGCHPLLCYLTSTARTSLAEKLSLAC